MGWVTDAGAARLSCVATVSKNDEVRKIRQVRLFSASLIFPKIQMSGVAPAWRFKSTRDPWTLDDSMLKMWIFGVVVFCPALRLRSSPCLLGRQHPFYFFLPLVFLASTFFVSHCFHIFRPVPELAF